MLFLAFGTLPNHNKNHSKIFFPIPPICPHTHTDGFDGLILRCLPTHPVTARSHALHVMILLIYRETFRDRGCESVLTFSFSCIYFPPFHLSVHVSLCVSSLVFMPLFVLILSSPLTFPLARFLCLCQCLHTNAKWLCSSFMVTVISWVEMHCGRFQRTDFTSAFYMCSYSPTKSGRHMFSSAKDFG